MPSGHTCTLDACRPAPGKHSVKNPIGGGVGHETSVLAAFAGWIERLARRNPVCLIAQELQWADDASLEQGRALGRALKDIPVLMLYSARSEFDDLRPGWWEASEGIQRIDLLPLSNGEMRQFLDHLLRHVADMVAAPCSRATH